MKKLSEMSNRERKALSAEEYESIEQDELKQYREEQKNFDMHMRYESLETEELTWLRDKLLELIK